MWPALSTIAALVVLVAVFGALHVGFYDNPLFSGGPYQYYGDAVVHGQVPYRDFEVEYPPGSLPAFVAPALVWPDRRQSTQYNRAFEGLMLLCAAAALIAMGTVRRGWPLFAFALAPLLLGSIVLHRYDFWPAALAVAALAAFRLRHEPVAFALLATATAAKVWPAVLLPLFLIAAKGRVRGAAVFTVVLALWFTPFLAVAPGGVWHTSGSRRRARSRSRVSVQAPSWLPVQRSSRSARMARTISAGKARGGRDRISGAQARDTACYLGRVCPQPPP